MSISEKLLNGLKAKSEKIYADKEKLSNILEKARKTIKKGGKFEKIREDLLLLMDLLSQSIRGKYKGISKKNIILIISAFLYLINPFDIIPDFIAGVGFLDDISVFAYLLSKISSEINEYRKWKVERENV